MCDAVAELEANSDKVAGEHQAAWDRIRKNLALHSPFEGAGRADNKQSEPLTTSIRDTTPPEVPPRFNPCPLHTYNGHSHLCLGRGRCNPTPLDSVYGIFSLTVNGTGRKTLEMRYIKSCLEGRRSKNPGSVSSDTPPTAEEIQAAEAHRTVTEQLGTLLFPQAESLARRNNKQRGEPSQGSKIIIEVAALMEMFRSNQRHHPEIETWFTIKEADADYTTTFKDRVAAVEAQITGDPLLFLCPSAEAEIDFMEQFDEDSQTSGGWQVDDDLVM
jgi:hypothetical protein